MTFAKLIGKLETIKSLSSSSSPHVESFAIISSADSNFFPLLKDLVCSIRDKLQGRAVPLYILDAGLTTSERSWLAQQRAKVMTFPWPYGLDVPGPQRVLAMRCQIPARLPGCDVYMWLDADTWVQDWGAIELYRRTAAERQFCMTAEVDRSFNLTEVMQWGVNTCKRLYGYGLARRLVGKPLLNAGAFAGRGDAPHWAAWQRRVDQVLSLTAADLFLDQTALNLLAYVDGFEIAILPAHNNWICHRALPRTTDDGMVLLDPEPPHQPLGVIHMTAQAKRHVFTLRTIGGGAVVRSLRYSAEPTRIVGAANPVTTEINLARADSFTQWHYKAAHRLRRLIAAHPENAEASECLGQVAMRDGDYGEAVRAFRHAAALQPDNFGIHVQLADVYLRQGRCDEAAVALRGALKLSPAAGDVRQRLESALAEQTMPAGDYVAPGLVRVRAERHFPNMVIGDCRDNLWPYLRRDSPHNWYVDRRVRNIGFVSRDEAHILFNTALQFEGMTALEIGCFMGFSTCHLALGGVRIDVVDPLLRDSRVMESVTSSLSSAGVIDACWFVPSPSPAAVEHLGEHEGRRWSLAFIDGDHEGDAPRHDAEVCERFLKPDALVLFHDLLSPDVAAGLHFFRGRGWKTRIYLTSQIMGVAWRGTVTPIEHIPDVAMSRDLPPHLAEWAADAS